MPPEKAEMTDAAPLPGGSDEGTAEHRSTGPLRLGVNLMPLTLASGGMRQYVLQLLPWLLRLSPHRLVLFHGLSAQPSVAGLLRRLGPAQRRRVAAVELRLQDDLFAHAGCFDVLFSPLNGLAPDLLDRPTLTTLADVQEQFFPHYFTPTQLADRARHYPRSARAATVLLTISDFSRRSICAAFGVPADKVRVTHLAANDEIVAAPAEWPAALEPLPARYVFYPANLYPHKGHRTLLDALRLLNHERRLDVSCVLTGQPAEPGIDLRQEIAARSLERKVRWLGHVAAAALRHLYENAVALAFPSQFEGFGMPLVEAMLCGCPVIAAPVASVPEVVGDAALLVQPSAEAFADSIARVLTEPALADDLRRRGRAQAARFQAARLAEQTLDAIDLAVRRFRAERATGGPAVSFVVRVRRGGRALVRALASLAFEALEHDEVLLLAEPARLGPEARALADNLGMVRFLGARGDWLSRVRHEVVCILDEGQRLVEGATASALAALAADPEARAVVGEVLALGRDNRITSCCYRPALPWSKNPPPSAAVFWSRALLAEHRAMLPRRRWTGAVLERAGGAVGVLYRSVACGKGRGRLARVKAAGRALVRRLPSWLQGPMRGLYRQLRAG
jgi:glycosyltransferase involved in cell wall biosynthesis